jgi:hypothetical protein
MLQLKDRDGIVIVQSPCNDVADGSGGSDKIRKP